MFLTHPILPRLLVQAALAAIAVAFAAGCTSEVSSSGTTPVTEGGGGATSGSGGAGGAGDVVECTVGATRACVASDAPGVQDCYLNNGKPAWTSCQVTTAPSAAVGTPLVFVFDDHPVDFQTTMAGAFDLTASGQCIASDWPSAATPWLALDRDGDGAIGGGSELFGSAVRLSSGRLANNGFEALRELDSNHDGRITPEDDAWSRLAIWSDRDADRASTSSELEPLAARRVLSIDLEYSRAPRCDARHNCEIERATFRYIGASGLPREGAIVDVHLALR